ncbi:MAG: acyl-CoA dehydrogenase family protein [Actinomycetota bacterium]|nr:acyl-CoA dehydrogenase family protein [Actinomycetota bacterium]
MSTASVAEGSSLAVSGPAVSAVLPGMEEEGLRADVRALARGVADRELAPRAAHWDEAGEFPQQSWEALVRADLTGLTIAEEYGGSALGDVESAVVLEELARVDVSSAILAQLTMNGPPRVIQHLGGAGVRERWLPRVARGELFISIGITEPDAGSAVGAMRAQLAADGDGYRLNAYKNYSTGGHRAGACLVWCRFPGSEGSRGIGAVVVDLSTEGVSVVGTHKNMGLHGLTEAELAFDDVWIDPDDVVIAADPSSSSAFRKLIGHLTHERCGNAAMCIGAAQGALERAIRYLRDRETGGRRLADLQGLQWKVADMAIELESARLLLYRAVGLAESSGGTPPPMESAMAKAAANLAAKHVCDEAMQLLGGYGYSAEEPLERAFRDVRGLCFGGGTVEIQRNYVGQSLLRGDAPHGPAWRLEEQS